MILFFIARPIIMLPRVSPRNEMLFVGTPWEYIFFIDFHGHVKDPAVAKALEELQGQTRYIKHLGSYPRFKE